MGRCRSISPLGYRFGEKALIMDTKSLDKQDKAHLQILSKFHVCGENQHHRDYRDAGDYGGNADLVLNMPYRH